jgi:septal ring factor EnvC (AmiA/AmiB activator)
MQRHASLLWIALVPWLAWAVPALSDSDAVLHAAVEESAEAHPALEADAEVQERSISILGCTLHMTDINRTVRCIQGRIDREVERTRNTLNQQIQQLEGDLEAARADVQTEVERTQRALDQQIRSLRRDLQRAQADLQRTARDLEQAQRDLQQQAGALFAGLDPATLAQLNLEPLIQCLSRTPSDLGRLVTDFAGDPARFAQAEFEAMWRIASRHMDRVMHQQLAALGRGSPNASVAGLVNEADRVMTALAAQRPASQCLWQALAQQRAQARRVALDVYPMVERHVNQLMTQHVQPAVFGAAAQNLGRVLAQATGAPAPARRPATAQRPPRPAPTAQTPARVRMDALGAQAMPIRTRGEEDGWIEVDDPMAAVAERSGDEAELPDDLMEHLMPGAKDLIKIAQGVAAKHLLEERKIRAVASHVSQLAEVLGDPIPSQQALMDVEGALASSEIWTELVALEIGMEVLRFAGKKFIDSKEPWGGDGLLEGGALVLDNVVTAVGFVVEGLCGLIPEVGAGGCAGVFGPVTVAYHTYAKVPAKTAMSIGLHVGWDTLVDAALKGMKEGHDPRRFREEAGPLAILLDIFPTRQAVILLGEKKVKPIKEALYAYHDSVRALSRAAVAQ